MSQRSIKLQFAVRHPPPPHVNVSCACFVQKSVRSLCQVKLLTHWRFAEMIRANVVSCGHWGCYWLSLEVKKKLSTKMIGGKSFLLLSVAVFQRFRSFSAWTTWLTNYSIWICERRVLKLEAHSEVLKERSAHSHLQSTKHLSQTRKCPIFKPRILLLNFSNDSLNVETCATLVNI